MQYTLNPEIKNYGIYCFTANTKTNLITGKVKKTGNTFCYGEYTYVSKNDYYIRYNQKGKKSIVKSLPDFVSCYDFKEYSWDIFSKPMRPTLNCKKTNNIYLLPEYEDLKGYRITFKINNVNKDIDLRTSKSFKISTLNIPLNIKNIKKYEYNRPINHNYLAFLFMIFKKYKLIKYINYIIINKIYNL